jgi:nucleoside-diphosphate-sugar epimerase
LINNLKKEGWMKRNTSEMKRIVLTGPTGTIGMALINQCIQQQVEVLALCKKGSEHIHRIPVSKFVRVVECDLGDLVNFSDENRYDVFYHFAWAGTMGNARNDRDIQTKNVQYTQDAVDLAKRLGCQTFIGAGSQAEYGRFEGTLTPNTPVSPESDYGKAKLNAGLKSRERCHQMGLKHIWVRIFSVYGPYDDDNTMVMSMIWKMLHGEIPQCTEGEQIWDYLYSEDAANALFLLGGKGIDGKIYCLGSGEARPLKMYIDIIRSIINKDARIEFGALPYSEQQVMHLCADIDDLKKDIGFSPKIGFEEGIQRIMQSSPYTSKE